MVREMQLRSLLRRMARVREMAVQQAAQREIAIRRHGTAHPRSIAAARRLHHTRAVHRRLQRMYRISVSEGARIKMHERA